MGGRLYFHDPDSGVTALGQAGAGLGYAGIRKSVALKFDLLNDVCEGLDSVGLLVDGTVSTRSSIDLRKTGINLHSGHGFKAHVTYDGERFTVSLTDTVTMASWSHAFPVYIPTIVGRDTAYVGFTGGTGALTASQGIISWDFASANSMPSTR